MQVKLIKAPYVAELETKINDFIKNKRVTSLIVDMLGTDILGTIVYED